MSNLMNTLKRWWGSQKDRTVMLYFSSVAGRIENSRIGIGKPRDFFKRHSHPKLLPIRWEMPSFLPQAPQM
jgi:hypothetical protein